MDKSKLRLNKPTNSTPPAYITNNEPSKDTSIRRLKPLQSTSSSGSLKTGTTDELEVGLIVMHERFGKGEILNLEGVGADKKAEIRFDVGGIKKLLLRFAKLKVIS